MKKLFLTSFLAAAAATSAALGGGTYTVLNADDSGPGSLRQTIIEASTGGTIGFAFTEPTTITLTSGELLVDKDLEMIADGPGKAVTVARSDAAETAQFRIFHISGNSTVTLSYLTITNGYPDNFTNFGNGGGILNDPGCTLIANHVVITGNSPVHGGGAPSGGGIFNDGTLTLNNSTVSENSAGGVFGGAGGGIWNHGTLTVNGSTISGNERGGIVNVGGTLTVTNSTISGNLLVEGIATPAGGITNDADATLTNCTITENTSLVSENAGGITNTGTVVATNCIVANNTAPTNPDVSGSLASGGHNLIGDDTGATITSSTGDQIGTGAAPIDPMLGPLQDNGGPTETHALLVGSPAIDQGGVIDGLTNDQRGLFRPVDDPAIAAAVGGDESDIGAFEMQAGQALNISTRLNVQTGDNILDGGFIITGTEPKRVLIRGIGPSLANFGVAGVLPDPFLELHHDVDIIAANGDWRSNQEAEIEATGLAPTDDAEAAILMTLQPGAYTAILEDLMGSSGIGLIEVYDLDSGAVSNLANISTRGLVETGDNVMIGGFIIAAGEGLPNQVVVRAIGPTLGNLGVANPLQDPDLELHDQDGVLIASNDNWKDTQQVEIEATGLAPENDSESALVQTLAAGPYTAIVRGSDQTSGVALVELYDLH